jgi:hypothetical protein
MPASQSPAMRQTGRPVEEILARVPDDYRRQDARRLCTIMAEVTGELDQDALRQLIHRSVRCVKASTALRAHPTVDRLPPDPAASPNEMRSSHSRAGPVVASSRRF